MNAHDVLQYGHKTVLATLDGIPLSHVITPGVCGRWSVKDIVAHLASFELVLVDVLNSLQGGPTLTLDGYRERSRNFNDTQVALRDSVPYPAVVSEYTAAHERVMSLISGQSAEILARVNTIPWYGPEYSIDDFIVYTNYAHKREHCAQIKLFKKTLG